MNNKNNIASAENRRQEFQRNMELESFLSSLNETLLPPENTLLDGLSHPDKPIFMLVGPMRSGTTLVMQWLAQTGLVGYPSNLMSRFYKAPVIGAKIQQLLTDTRYQFRDEFADISPHTDFSSENGKTRGFLAPNEFWYFWRQFISSSKGDCWSSAELAASLDAEKMLRELHGLTSVFGKPFAIKAMKFNYAIEHLHSLSRKFVFIHVHRKPAHNMASVLAARQRQFGNLQDWYSFKVPEHSSLEKLSPQQQVAGQIYSLNRAVSTGLEHVPAANVIDCSYEAFCGDPKRIYELITDKLAVSGGGHKYCAPKKFEVPSFDASYGSEAELEEIYEEISKIIEGLG